MNKVWMKALGLVGISAAGTVGFRAGWKAWKKRRDQEKSDRELMNTIISNQNKLMVTCEVSNELTAKVIELMEQARKDAEDGIDPRTIETDEIE